jgi:hypothetical protein
MRGTKTSSEIRSHWPNVLHVKGTMIKYQFFFFSKKYVNKRENTKAEVKGTEKKENVVFTREWKRDKP